MRLPQTVLLCVGEWGLENAKSSKEKTTLEDALSLLTAVAVWPDGLVALLGATAGAVEAGTPNGCVCRCPSAISGGDEYGAVVGDWAEGGGRQRRHSRSLPQRHHHRGAHGSAVRRRLSSGGDGSGGEMRMRVRM